MVAGAVIYVVGLLVMSAAQGATALIVSGGLIGVALSCTASSLGLTAAARGGVRPQPLAYCAEHCQRQSPARLHRAAHVLKGGYWIAKKHDSKARERQLEAVGCERMDRSVGDDGLRVLQAGSRDPFARPGDRWGRRALSG